MGKYKLIDNVNVLSEFDYNPLQWMPISSAPYDTVVLFWHGSGNIAQGFVYDTTNEEFAKSTGFTHWLHKINPPED